MDAYVNDARVANRLWLAIRAMKQHNLPPFHAMLRRTACERRWVAARPVKQRSAYKLGWEKGPPPRMQLPDGITPLEAPRVGEEVYMWWKEAGWFGGRVRDWTCWQLEAPKKGHLWVRLGDGEEHELDVANHLWSREAPATPDVRTSHGVGVQCSTHGYTLVPGSCHNIDPPAHIHRQTEQPLQSKRKCLRSAVRLRAAATSTRTNMATATVGSCVWDSQLKAFAVSISQNAEGQMELLYCKHIPVPRWKAADSSSLVWLGGNAYCLDGEAKRHLRSLGMLPATPFLEEQMRAVVEWEHSIQPIAFKSTWRKKQVAKWVAHCLSCGSVEEGVALVGAMASHLHSWPVMGLELPDGIAAALRVVEDLVVGGVG